MEWWENFLRAKERELTAVSLSGQQHICTFDAKTLYGSRLKTNTLLWNWSHGLSVSWRLLVEKAAGQTYFTFYFCLILCMYLFIFYFTDPGSPSSIRTPNIYKMARFSLATSLINMDTIQLIYYIFTNIIFFLKENLFYISVHWPPGAQK